MAKTKKTVKIFGNTVTVGTKKHAKLAELKRLMDIDAKEERRYGNSWSN